MDGRKSSLNRLKLGSWQCCLGRHFYGNTPPQVLLLEVKPEYLFILLLARRPLTCYDCRYIQVSCNSPFIGSSSVSYSPIGSSSVGCYLFSSSSAGCSLVLVALPLVALT